MLVIFNPAEVVEDCSGCRLCWMRWSAACTLGIEGSLHAVCAAAAAAAAEACRSCSLALAKNCLGALSTRAARGCGFGWMRWIAACALEIGSSLHAVQLAHMTCLFFMCSGCSAPSESPRFMCVASVCVVCGRACSLDLCACVWPVLLVLLGGASPLLLFFILEALAHLQP